ncbi:MAG TPA: GDP-mannose 4,6-dehydratase [Patescibacteria group bacterium]|nr:GDP-mannose 4,6-dehydratase [Patescibacteria group bacterium]
MKKILITGASGFVGGWLAQHLLTLGNAEIFGTYLNEESKESSLVKDKITFIQADLHDKSVVETLIEKVKPDEVYHLAALASVGKSFKDPVGTFHTNIDSEIFLLEALRQHDLLSTRVLIVSSAEVYGYVTPEDLPIDENTPLRPANPYAVSKIAQDYLGIQYAISYKMPIIRVRPFNHIGPRQGLGFVISDFTKQIADIEKGIQEPIIKVGNLEAKRDFTDVRDMVKAYPLLLEKGEVGEVYNVGSGISYKIGDLLDKMIAMATVKIEKQIDPERLRPSDVAEIVADNTKMQKVTGWKPEIAIETTLKNTLDYWRDLS